MRMLVVTNFFNISVIDFDAKKSAGYSWEVVVAEYVENGTCFIHLFLAYADQFKEIIRRTPSMFPHQVASRFAPKASSRQNVAICIA